MSLPGQSPVRDDDVNLTEPPVPPPVPAPPEIPGGLEEALQALKSIFASQEGEPNVFNIPGEFVPQLAGTSETDIASTGAEAPGSEMDRFNRKGLEEFPGIPTGAAHHASISEDVTNRLGGGGLGVAAANIGGLGVEGLEALTAPTMGSGVNQSPESRRDTLQDILANAGGSLAGAVSPTAAVPVRAATGALTGPIGDILSSLLESALAGE